MSAGRSALASTAVAGVARIGLGANLARRYATGAGFASGGGLGAVVAHWGVMIRVASVTSRERGRSGLASERLGEFRRYRRTVKIGGVGISFTVAIKFLEHIPSLLRQRPRSEATERRCSEKRRQVR